MNAILILIILEYTVQNHGIDVKIHAVIVMMTTIVVRDGYFRGVFMEQKYRKNRVEYAITYCCYNKIKRGYIYSRT
jgi:hypothetical protein